jgi:hypothetical protein
VTFEAGTFTTLGASVVVVGAGTVVVVEVVAAVEVGAGTVVVVGRVVAVDAVVGGVVVVAGGTVGFDDAALVALVQPASTTSTSGATVNRKVDRAVRREIIRFGTNPQ